MSQAENIGHRSRVIRRLLYGVSLALVVVVGTGCAMTAPAQEMSDARQALQAAEQVQAPSYARAVYERAERLLRQAEEQLEAGDYSEARRLAAESRDWAIRARQDAEVR
ncbi:DUF4398 domain-containing protein [Ectothiorhodosinus mongolicus]|nr:DUF4398 domain-containing protein [Ectothiorhodosinus mongolicus]